MHLPAVAQSCTIGALSNAFRRIRVFDTSAENLVERVSPSLILFLPESRDVFQVFFVNLRKSLQGASFVQVIQW